MALVQYLCVCSSSVVIFVSIFVFQTFSFYSDMIYTEVLSENVHLLGS